jgi:hypothetical protein
MGLRRRLPLEMWGDETGGGNAGLWKAYGAEGWVAHVVTNAWGYSAPGWGLGWGMFVTGGVWIALHLWEHYRFTLDQAFLGEKAYPALRDAAKFFLSYMVEHPTKKWLVTGPSNSPENWFIAPDTRKPCSDSMGPTCDRVLVYALFSACMQASELLGLDEALRAQIAEPGIVYHRCRSANMASCRSGSKTSTRPNSTIVIPSTS